MMNLVKIKKRKVMRKMKSKKMILLIVLCVLLCVSLCITTSILTATFLQSNEKDEDVISVIDKEKTNDEYVELEKSEVEDKKAEKTKEKTRLTYNGVDYLVSNGKLIITGEGTVTKSAVSELSPKFNVVDFESGTFDIGDGAFEGYTNITDIMLRNNVYDIGKCAFKGCSIPIIVFGNSITGVDDGAFEDTCLDYVFINNEYIFRNFNSRYDFGGVGTTASNIYVYKDLVPFEYNEDYSRYNAVAGDFLTSGGVFDELTAERGTTLSEQHYHYDGYFHEQCCYFCCVSSRGVSAWVIASEYDSDRNIMEWHIDADYWKDKGIDVDFYTKEHLDGVTYNNSNVVSSTQSRNKNDISETVESVESKENINTNTTANLTRNSAARRSESCYICGGTGSKQCTSCHGQGYYYEYDNFGGGKLTQIKKTCMVCRGYGKVKCYH